MLFSEVTFISIKAENCNYQGGPLEWIIDYCGRFKSESCFYLEFPFENKLLYLEKIGLFKDYLKEHSYLILIEVML